MERKSAQVAALLELMRIGSGHATAALADLVGRALWTRGPRATWHDPGAPASGRQPCTAVLFEVDGALQGVVALLLAADARDELVARLVGGDPDVVPRALLESAVQELGNIVVSHVCSAVADTLAARLLPSLPTLALEEGERELAALTARRGSGRLRVETGIADAEGRLQGRLVFVPDP